MKTVTVKISTEMLQVRNVFFPAGVHSTPVTSSHPTRSKLDLAKFDLNSVLDKLLHCWL